MTTGLLLGALAIVAIVLILWCGIRRDLRRVDGARELIEAALLAGTRYRRVRQPDGTMGLALPDEWLSCDAAVDYLVRCAYETKDALEASEAP